MKGSEDLHHLVSSYESYEWATFNADALSVGHVIHLWTINKKVYSKAVTDICVKLKISESSVNCTSLRLQLKRTVDKFNLLKRNIGRNWTKISEYLASEFTIPALAIKPVAAPIPTPAHTSCVSPKKLKKDCDLCPVQRHSAVKLAEELKKAKVEKRRTVAEIKRGYKVKVVNQRLSRNAKRREKLSSGLAAAERTCKTLCIKLQQKKEQCQKLSSKVSSLEAEKAALLQEKSSALEELKHLKRKVRDQEQSLSHLTCLLEETAEQPLATIDTRPSKSYIAPMRLCVYKSLLSHVPVANIGSLIQYTLKSLGQKSLSHTPSQTTIAQMAYELGVLCLVQLTDFLLGHRNLCLSWDATSLDGSHVNEIHVTSEQTRCMTLDIQVLPGGTAEDYTTHVVSALSEAASTYAKYEGIPEAEVHAKIVQAMTSTVTDRAAVNHATVLKLQEALGSQLLELNCNVHPLDSMASASRTALSQWDKEIGVTGKCLGRNAAATNCIMAVSKLRFKQGTGDPSGFKTHFRGLGVPIGTFVRYVGNRMHILFHLAGVLVAQRLNLLNFVSMHKTGLKGSLKEDLENPLIVVQLKALGLIGKLITGPWMTKFYSNKSNLDMVPNIKEGRDTLEMWCEDPTKAVKADSNIFGEPLIASDDPVLSALVGETDDMLIEVLRRLFKAIRTVYTRQLCRYLNTTDLAEPTEQQLQAASSAPSHNMASERALGMTDAQWKRAPNATSGFLNGKVRSSLNKTLEWLEERKDKDRLVGFAVSEGYKARSREDSKKNVLEKELKRRQDLGRQQRDAAHRKKIASAVQSGLNSNNFVSSLAEFEFAQETLAVADQIANTPSSIIGCLIEHVWFDMDKGEEAWYGRASEVEATRKRKIGQSSICVSVGYWSKLDIEANAEDYSIPLQDIIVDLLLGDLSFVN